MSHTERPCRDCGRSTTAPPKIESGPICCDCRSKYLRTKPINFVEEVLRLARDFLDAELTAP